MTKKQHLGGHETAFKRWFSEFETARRSQKLSPGRSPKGIRPAPTSPDELRRMLDNSLAVVGPARALAVLGVHRTTLSRWLSGETQIPESASLVLRLLSDGLHPAASDDWAGFRFDGDRLLLPDGSSYTAREIQGFHYLSQALDAQRRKAEALESTVIDLVKRLERDTANDAFSQPTDPRSRAFIAT